VANHKLHTLQSRHSPAFRPDPPPTRSTSPEFERIDHNIEAGAKYLRYMVTHYYANEPMDQMTEGLFALASYNAGPDRIETPRPLAAKEGYDPNCWFKTRA
jgi:membrane-bound lytic murein transglycosylase MltF